MPPPFPPSPARPPLRPVHEMMAQILENVCVDPPPAALPEITVLTMLREPALMIAPPSLPSSCVHERVRMGPVVQLDGVPALPLVSVRPLSVTCTFVATLRIWTALAPLIVVLDEPAPLMTVLRVRARPLPLSV